MAVRAINNPLVNPVLGVEHETAFSRSLVIEPTSRWPLELPEATVSAVLDAPILPRAIEREQGQRAIVSIVMLTRNGLAVTKLCLQSLIANTDHADYEVIVVDNESSDGTRDFLLELSRIHSHVKPIFNNQNLGFAAGNNQGVSIATGDVLVLLNNDTIVPPGWLTRLLDYLEDPEIGLVGPSTNRCGNEAQIASGYKTYGELLDFSIEVQRSNRGNLSDIRTAIMFCVALRRDVFERVGPLDERFEIGMFEDDDYAMRVREAGYRVGFAGDAFVHHFGQGSIGQLAASGDYGPLFHANRQRFEEKWGVTWVPHEGQPKPEYDRLRDRIRATVEANVPTGATVLVASKGDEELVKIPGRAVWHFPQTISGDYAGHHPEDSAAAIRDLEALRAKGADYFLIPSTLFWWLDHYPGIKQHLNDLYPSTAVNTEDCLLVSLLPNRSPSPGYSRD